MIVNSLHAFVCLAIYLYSLYETGYLNTYSICNKNLSLSVAKLVLLVETKQNGCSELFWPVIRINQKPNYIAITAARVSFLNLLASIRLPNLCEHWTQTPGKISLAPGNSRTREFSF